LDQLAKGTKSITDCLQNESINQIALKHCTRLQTVRGYCWAAVQRLEI